MHTSGQKFDELPDQVMLHLNQTCNRFEQRWKAGEQPNIEDMLDDVESNYRQTLLRELVSVDKEYRLRAGLDASYSYYHSRFPLLGGVVPNEFLTSPAQDESTDDQRGRVIAHYRLEQRLGAGGMGEVYRAHDIALGRDCAIKILGDRFSPHLRDRIVREARAHARLQHPGIASFYESGEDGDQSFLAIELVQGQTLRKRLDDEVLSWEETMQLAASLLEALGHAHAVGILHRDIKPDNIMVSDRGTIKLVDFGLAKDYAARHGEDRTVSILTGEGTIVGTVGYMSPEQLRGEELDERSDLFSVGAVLYEAVTGRLAFPGATSAERIAAILSSDPEPIDRPDIPAEFNSICLKAMAREPSLRYANVAALLGDLRLVGSGELSSGLAKSLAIFDFENLFGRQEDDWIGVGVAEALCASLGVVPGIEVMPRERLSRLRISEPDVERQTLALKLGCHWVLDGSFQKIGNALRFTVQLIEVLTRETIVNRQIDCNCDAIFGLQDQIAALVRDEIGQIDVPAAQSEAKRPQHSAYECYVNGRQAWLHTDKGRLDRAQEWFSRAVAAEPNYAPALSGMATINSFRYIFTTDMAFLDTAEEYAIRAIESDPKLSEPHVWIGYIHFHRGNLEAARQEEQAAITLDPKNLWAYYFAGFFAYLDIDASRREMQLPSGHASIQETHRDRRGKGLEMLQRALELDEQHGWAWLGAGVLHMEREQFSESRWCFEQGLELESTPQRMTAGIEGCMAECLRRAGDYDQARAHCLRGMNALDNTDNIYRDTFRAVFLCVLGETALAQDDTMAARTAFRQAILHSEGRNRARSIGHPFVQALCGLARTDLDVERFRKALSLFRARAEANFDPFWLCSDDTTLLALTRGANAVMDFGLARQLRAEAIDCGSSEAAHLTLR